MSIGQGWPDWGGTPNLSGELVLRPQTTISLAPGAFTTFTVPVIRPSYAFFISVYNSTSTTVTSSMKVNIEWLDQLGSFEVDRQVWILRGGTLGSPHIVTGKGPTIGNQCAVTITNLGATQTLSLTYAMVETTHTYSNHDWRTDDESPIAYSGFAGNILTSHLTTNVIAWFNGVAVTTGSGFDMLLPLYSGRASIQASTDSTAVAPFLALTPGIDPTSPANAGVQQIGPLTVGNIQQDIMFPRSQCTIHFQVLNAGTAHVFGGIVAERW